MARLARQGVRALRPLVEDVAGGAFDPVQAWDSFVRAVYRYRDEDREIVRTIPHMLDFFQEYGYLEGDCDCISTFNASATTALGFPSRFVAIRTDQFDPEFLHVFSEAWDGSKWKRLDPTVPLTIVNREIDYGRLEQNI